MYRPLHINLCNVTFNNRFRVHYNQSLGLFSKNNTNVMFVAQKHTNINIRQSFSSGFHKMRRISR